MANAKIYKVSLQRNVQSRNDAKGALRLDQDRIFTVALYSTFDKDFKDLVNKFEAFGWCPSEDYGIIKTAHVFDVDTVPGSPVSILHALHLKGYTNVCHETSLYEYENDIISRGKKVIIDSTDSLIEFTKLVWLYMGADFIKLAPSPLLQKAADGYNNSGCLYRNTEWFM